MHRSLLTLAATLVLSSWPMIACQNAASGGDQAGTSVALDQRSAGGVPAELLAAVLEGDPQVLERALQKELREHPEQAQLCAWIRACQAQARATDAASRALALAAYQEFETRFEHSPWLARSRWARAELLRQLGRNAEAEALVEGEVERLRATQRQDELVAAILELAESALDPLGDPLAALAPSAVHPQLARQAALQALALEPSASMRASVLALLARAHTLLNEWPQAEQQQRAWLTAVEGNFDSTRPALIELAQIGAMHVELARSLLRQGQYTQARAEAEDLIARLDQELAHPGSWSAVLASQPEQLARRLETVRGDALLVRYESFAQAGDGASFEQAVATLRRFLAETSTHAQRRSSAYRLAEGYAQRGRSSEELEAWTLCAGLAAVALPSDGQADGQADSQALEFEREDQRLQQSARFRAAQALLNLGRYEEASAAFLRYTHDFPTGANWSEAQASILTTERRAALSALEQRRYADARVGLRAFLNAHPLDESAAALELRLAQLELEQLDLPEPGNPAPLPGSPAELAQLQAARLQFERVVALHAGSEQASLALYQLGVLQETRLNEPEQAVKAWKRCTFGSAATDAAAALARIQAAELRLETLRTYRSDERPSVQISLRNLGSCKVSTYALDLEAFFRKHRTHLAVQELDLDLIEPDSSFEHELSDARELRLHQFDLEVPVQGPGVWAVVVEAGELRATTLLVQSDLEVLVKSSPAEVFVFAQDLRLGRAQPQARVLVALNAPSGAARLLELVTDEQGVARARVDEDPALDWGTAEVAVLAVHQGHAAAQGLSLSGQRLAQGRSARGSVDFDRPAYRPGETLAWRALQRDVLEGLYSFEPGRICRIELFDPNQRLIHSSQLALSDFGSVQGEFVLPEQASPGRWSLRCTPRGASSFQGSFEVGRFLLDALEFQLVAARPFTSRAAGAVLEARAQWSWGAPLEGARVRFDLPDGRQQEVLTDAQGLARLDYPTRDVLGATRLNFDATLVEHDRSASAVVFVSLREFRVQLASARLEYALGEQARIELSTLADDGSGVSAKLQLELVELQTDVLGITRELPVESRALSTAALGHSSSSLSLPRAGRYRVRASGTDRQGELCSGTLELLVRGAQDALRLQWLEGARECPVGSTQRFELFDRGQGGLALLSLEAERVLWHRLVQLEPGRNSLELVIPAAALPNAVLSIARLRTGALDSAELDLAVEQRLTLELLGWKSEPEPGAELELSLLARDANGQPIQAQFALSIFDAALLERFPERAPGPLQVFRPQPRERAALTQAASTLFHFAASTRRISSAVLAEAERRASEKAWKDERKELLADALSGKLQRSAPADSARSAERRDFDVSDAEAEGTSAPEGFGGKYGGRYGGSRKAGAGATPPPVPEALSAFQIQDLRTGPDGRATLRVRLPERSAHWQLVTQAAGSKAHPEAFAELRVDARTQAPLLLELLAPEHLTEGDRPRLLARVHTALASDCKAELVLRARSGGELQVLPLAVDLAARASHEFVFPALASLALQDGAGDELELELECRWSQAGAEHTASVALAVPVSPWGLEVVDSYSGSLRASQRIELALPASARARLLELFVGPDLESTLVAEALGQNAPRLRAPGPPQGDSSSMAASELLGLCALLELAEQRGPAAYAQLPALRGRAEALLAQLLAAEDRNGLFTNARPAEPADALQSARCSWALGAAQHAGLDLPAQALGEAAAALALLQRNPALSDDQRSEVLAAQCTLGLRDLSLANRLHRSRASASDSALAYLALALVDLEQPSMALEVATELERRVRPDNPVRCWEGQSNLSWNRAPIDGDALALLALLRAAPGSTAIEAVAASLLARRPWPAPRSRGLALAALAKHAQSQAHSSGECRVSIALPDGSERVLRFPAGSGGQQLTLALDEAVPAHFALELALEGRAPVQVLARVSGFSRSLDLPGSRGLILQPTRLSSSAPSYRGRALQTGFACLSDQEGLWTNEVAQLELGSRTLLQLDFWLDTEQWKQELQPDYALVLDLPLPAGTSVVPGSLQSEALEIEELPDRLRLHFSGQRWYSSLALELAGVRPGHYRSLPPRLWNAWDPGSSTFGKPLELEVLAAGEASGDPYRATPDELLSHGLAASEAGEGQLAWKLLTELFDNYEARLGNSALRTGSLVLLRLAIERQDARAMVRYFEILRENDPDLVLPFAQFLSVGRAYRQLEEYARAHALFSAAAEQLFGLELRVASLEEQAGNFGAACDWLERLAGEYPASPAVLESQLSLSDKLLRMAPLAAQDARLVAAGRNRAWLTREGLLVLQRFLAFHTRDPLAPEAGLGLVSAHLELEDHERAAELAGQLSKAYVEPTFADAFAYSQAVAQWLLGEDDAALEALERIAQARYTDASGNAQSSKNRDLALYILAQIHHARREPGRALDYYDQVAGIYPDARAAAAQIRSRQLACAEITEARPGSSVAIAVTHKNIAELDLLVYPVDLMTLYLRERSLSGVAGIELSGIAPKVRKQVRLDGTDQLRALSTEVALELPDPGAYLVLCRGGELFASGLVLVSDLALQVEEDALSGSLRVQALDSHSGHFLADVDVRVIGSQNTDFQSGRSDPRGLFWASNLLGSATVIARRGTQHYALYRGTLALGAVPEIAARRLRELGYSDAEGADQAVEQDKTSYYKNVLELNFANQAARGQRFGQQLENATEGVQLKSVE